MSACVCLFVFVPAYLRAHCLCCGSLCFILRDHALLLSIVQAKQMITLPDPITLDIVDFLEACEGALVLLSFFCSHTRMHTHSHTFTHTHTHLSLAMQSTARSSRRWTSCPFSPTSPLTLAGTRLHTSPGS